MGSADHSTPRHHPPGALETSQKETLRGQPSPPEEAHCLSFKTRGWAGGHRAQPQLSGHLQAV